MPDLSKYFSQKQPSAIRMAQMQFAKRTDGVDAINVSVGNVSLPMHPALQKRLFEIKNSESPLAQGIVQYTQTVGLEETNKAFLHIIASSGCSTTNLYSQITDGGTQAMELVLLGVTDANDRPILLIDPAYTNYLSLAQRTSRKTISISRTLQEDGNFSLPTEHEIDLLIQQYNPAALIIIPYDNPTGQLMSGTDLMMMARLCVRHNMWMISDEAYRELYYTP
jgi:aspartate aminotransferase